MKTIKHNKTGQGRTKGSFSYAAIASKDLLAANPNPEFKWLVSRKQLNAMGITNIEGVSLSNVVEDVAAKVQVSEL